MLISADGVVRLGILTVAKVGLGTAPFAPAGAAAITAIREISINAEIAAVKAFALMSLLVFLPPFPTFAPQHSLLDHQMGYNVGKASGLLVALLQVGLDIYQSFIGLVRDPDRGHENQIKR